MVPLTMHSRSDPRPETVARTSRLPCCRAARKVSVSEATISVFDLGLFVQDQVQQRAMNLYLAVVIDESQLAEFVHEEAHARPRGADHLRQRLLADFRQDRLGLTFFAEIREKEKRSRQPL